MRDDHVPRPPRVMRSAGGTRRGRAPSDHWARSGGPRPSRPAATVTVSVSSSRASRTGHGSCSTGTTRIRPRCRVNARHRLVSHTAVGSGSTCRPSCTVASYAGPPGPRRPEYDTVSPSRCRSRSARKVRSPDAQPRHAHRERVDDVEAQEPQAVRSPGTTHIGAQVGLERRPPAPSAPQPRQPGSHVRHLEGRETHPRRPVVRVDLQPGRQQPLQAVGLDPPVREQHRSPRTERHRRGDVLLRGALGHRRLLTHRTSTP